MGNSGRILMARQILAVTVPSNVIPFTKVWLDLISSKTQGFFSKHVV